MEQGAKEGNRSSTTADGDNDAQSKPAAVLGAGAQPPAMEATIMRRDREGRGENHLGWTVGLEIWSYLVEQREHIEPFFNFFASDLYKNCNSLTYTGRF